MLFSAAGMLAGPVPAVAEDTAGQTRSASEQFFTEEAARARVFGSGCSYRDTSFHIDSIARQELYEATGLQEKDSTVRLTRVFDSAGAPCGAYRVASEIGKYLYFDFLVGVDGKGKVKDIVVLNYAETRGGEVRRERFLSQYRGKTVASPVRLNRDILGIAGATLSAWAVNRGVKKTLWWCARVEPAGTKK